MTTKSQAVDQLAQLHNSYCPLLDELIAMAESEPITTPAPDFAWYSSVALSTDTTNSVILEEQQQAEEIWTLGKIAWGARVGVQLKFMKAVKDDLREIEDILKHRRLDDAHRAALIGCCVRSQRLSNFLAESKVQLQSVVDLSADDPPAPCFGTKEETEQAYIEHVEATREETGHAPSWKVDEAWAKKNDIRRDRLRELRKISPARTPEDRKPGLRKLAK